MGKIRVLPEPLANKIAAGEVIERPASIVKELVENALDAGAAMVEIEIEHGGRSLIRVSDNGCGMDAGDAKLAFQRHATSKIACLEDLEAVSSFGFRGEAIPSIAAVSRCRLITRFRGASAGTEVVVEGGVVQAVQEHSCREGTIVEVRDLFFNTPARRKFLKAESTETGNILDAVTRMALGAPLVQFALRSGEKTFLRLVPVERLADRMSVMLGGLDAGEFLDLDREREGLRLRGLLGKPALNRGNRSQIQIYVNGRWVRSLPLSYALQAGYHGRLMEGRFPVAVLFVQVDPARVDVNVHPTKQEVRISSEQELTAFVREAVRERLLISGEMAPALQLAAAPPGASIRDYPLKSTTVSRPDSWSVFDRPPAPGPCAAAEPSEPLAIQDKLRITRILGPLHQTFIVAETEEGFVLVDQHAAHERVVFEALLANLRGAQPQRQMLFLEETLQIHPRQRELFGRARGLLEKVGFDLEPFGEGTWVIRAAPAALVEIDPVSLLRDFLDQMEEGKGSALEEAAVAVAALCACKKQSVKAGDSLNPWEMQKLLERLAACENPFHCPHGRPTFFTQSLNQLEKQFKRV